VTHRNCLRWLDVPGRYDHRRSGRKYLHGAIVWPNGHLLPTLRAEVMGIVAHFHAKWEKGAANATEETAASCCHSVQHQHQHQKEE
jgi:hypothetical protein